jgi:single-strand DNA-binding protein
VNETVVTLIGNVATDVRSTTTQAGVPISSFRVASTTRRFERGKGWIDLDTLYVTVVCWRALAENVAAALAKGDPVVVSGRLRMRQWTADDGRAGTSVELEASTAGHDLTRGVSRFSRVRPRDADRPGRSEADDLAELVAREPLVPLPADASLATAAVASVAAATPAAALPAAAKPGDAEPAEAGPSVAEPAAAHPADAPAPVETKPGPKTGGKSAAAARARGQAAAGAAA